MDGESVDLKWFDISSWGVEGKGWEKEAHERLYDRLPVRAKGIVTESVWDLSHSPTGICVHFDSDSTRVHVRWTLESEQLGEPNFNVAGFSGVDLYADDNGSWRWAAAPAWNTINGKTPESCLIEGLPKAMRKYRLYLPHRNPVAKVEIGVEASASFAPVAPRKDKPLVYYGTSIVHGAYASRAGMGHPQILGRRLGLPLVNLGFSGNARMEEPFAKFIAEIDAAVFVIDALPNMDAALVKERAEAFIRAIRKARPATPIVLVEDHPLMVSWLKPEVMRSHKDKWRELSKVYRKLIKEGFSKLLYVKGAKLFGTDNEAAVDGLHPTDLGFMRMADILEKTMVKALSSK